MHGMHSARYINAAALREGLDHDGCAFGQVTRERVDNLVAHLQAMESKVNMIAAGVGLQLVAFFFAVIIFLLNHTR